MRRGCIADAAHGAGACRGHHPWPQPRPSAGHPAARRHVRQHEREHPPLAGEHHGG